MAICLDEVAGQRPRRRCRQSLRESVASAASISGDHDPNANLGCTLHLLVLGAEALMPNTVQERQDSFGGMLEAMVDS